MAETTARAPGLCLVEAALMPIFPQEMNDMAKLSDLQLVLLSTAAARDNGSLMPPASSVAAQAGRVRQAIATLVKRALASDVAVKDQGLSYRADGDALYGAAITDGGREAIGAPVVDTKKLDQVPAPVSDAPAAEAAAPTKSANVLALLRRTDGASLTELVEATGWLPHTTRAALTGLRKKGHAIIRTGAVGTTRYHLAA